MSAAVSWTLRPILSKRGVPRSASVSLTAKEKVGLGDERRLRRCGEPAVVNDGYVLEAIGIHLQSLSI